MYWIIFLKVLKIGENVVKCYDLWLFFPVFQQLYTKPWRWKLKILKVSKMLCKRISKINISRITWWLLQFFIFKSAFYISKWTDFLQLPRKSIFEMTKFASTFSESALKCTLKMNQRFHNQLKNRQIWVLKSTLHQFLTMFHDFAGKSKVFSCFSILDQMV